MAAPVPEIMDMPSYIEAMRRFEVRKPFVIINCNPI
jgi:hypothetical protein